MFSVLAYYTATLLVDCFGVLAQRFSQYKGMHGPHAACAPALPLPSTSSGPGKAAIGNAPGLPKCSVLGPWCPRICIRDT